MSGGALLRFPVIVIAKDTVFNCRKSFYGYILQAKNTMQWTH